MSKRVRDALRAIETYRVDSLDDADTRLPKATVNMVVDLLEAALEEAHGTYAVTEETLAEAIRQAFPYSPNTVDDEDEWFASPRAMARDALARLGLEADAE